MSLQRLHGGSDSVSWCLHTICIGEDLDDDQVLKPGVNGALPSDGMLSGSPDQWGIFSLPRASDPMLRASFSNGWLAVLQSLVAEQMHLLALSELRELRQCFTPAVPLARTCRALSMRDSSCDTKHNLSDPHSFRTGHCHAFDLSVTVKSDNPDTFVCQC